MNVAFRIDSSREIGAGHLSRCMALGRLLLSRGAAVKLVTRTPQGSTGHSLVPTGVEVLQLPASRIDHRPEDYASWLGEDPPTDSAQTADLLSAEGVDLLVADHYGVDLAWERALARVAGKMLTVDDLAHREFAADAVLNQNYPGVPERYAGKVSAATALLLGPRYALLSGDYAAARQGSVHDPSRVLVFFGAADFHDASGLVLEALSDAEFRELRIDLVVGAQNPHLESLRRVAAQRGGVDIHISVASLAPLMQRAGFAIGAGGTTTWERMCLGVPAIVASIAQNQVPGCEQLARDGLIEYLGDIRGVDVAALRRSVRAHRAHPEVLEAAARRGMALVDGLGAARVAEAVWPTAAEAVSLRPAVQGDAETYYFWANDPEVRAQSIQTAAIAWPVHLDWFARKLADPDAHLFVAVTPQGLPVGQIRFDVEDGVAEIDYSVDPMARGRGWGRRLMALGLEAMRGRGVRDFRGQVKPSNRRSKAVFEELGFQKAGPEGELLSFVMR
jgi:UDP-2,4-diacetamido-2,4,6-trideoxy-beta-L-altropyranose hydrolase